MNTFRNKVVVVTGGSHGIGRNTAIEFAKEGAQVSIADIDIVQGENIVNEIKDKFTVVRFDEDMESVLPYVARIVSEMNNSSRISETFSEFKEAVGTAGEIQVQMVEADHPENPANLVFDNVTKKNQHIISYMSEHVLDENIQTLMKQIAIDYPRYDVPMKNESLVALQ